MTRSRGSLFAFFCFVVALCTGIGVSPPASANGDSVEISSNFSRSIKVAKGKTVTIRAVQRFDEIVIGNPEIATVTPLTDRSFYILGNELGSTSVTIFDAEKNPVGIIDIEVTLDTKLLSSTIRQSVPGSSVKVTSANGRIVLSGSATDAVAATQAEQIASRFAGDEEVINSIKITSSQQVQLNVRFVEINRDVGKELGTQISAAYAWSNGSVEFNSSPRATSNTPAGSLIGSLIGEGYSVDVAIDALEDRGMARRLAEPNLIARSGETSSFLAGGEFPIPISEQDGTITVSYKKFGVGLDFTPTVLSDGLIALDIEPEVSAIDNTASYRVGNIAIPGFSVRRARTSVDLKSGQSFMIAGLLQSENNLITQRVPGLGQLPILGALFSSKAYQRRETDLVIIVTPHLVKPIDPLKKVASPSDRTKRPTEAEFFLGNIDEVEVNGRGRSASRQARVVRAPSSGHFLELQ
ncbi:type II and III secretion system protein family protein [Sinorhizobium meliloti]|uniref:type II and III secretion system protein family protein n=1 Tax=Rhizobium meliloti TaxID=382 RepID=UPI000D1ECA46|nr:type II and III secretion system protein family protein [Sinorhizobium meliloti]MDE3823442.1 type II and III secretion system protein family protein [Sinorhizobium meliloti]MDW9758993.1 BON domain-containing protein [Sinorhizobium meliloti]QGJ76469.1 secretin [Sinorhizobium meliloti]QND30710.1 type II and III secretion system protein family protein [Sinorhizobium meliloti]RMI05247.1 type II and III secretion system protein family protein [Sinorhizobium meliloti]